MPQLHATLLLAAFFALLAVPLSLQISLRRMQVGSDASDGGGDMVLQRRIRAHRNFSEYAPLALICTGLVEYSSASTALVWAIAGAFALSRVLHATVMLYMSSPKPRGIPMMIQHAAFLAAAVWLITHVF
ncbi:MAG: MAPEG family protein [Burkholderiaceae bacterium]